MKNNPRATVFGAHQIGSLELSVRGKSNFQLVNVSVTHNIINSGLKVL